MIIIPRYNWQYCFHKHEKEPESRPPPKLEFRQKSGIWQNYFFLFFHIETIIKQNHSTSYSKGKRNTKLLPCLLLIKPFLPPTLRRMSVHLLLFRWWKKLLSQRWSVRPCWSLLATRTVPAPIPRGSISQRRRQRRPTLFMEVFEMVMLDRRIGMLIVLDWMRRTVTHTKDATGIQGSPWAFLTAGRRRRSRRSRSRSSVPVPIESVSVVAEPQP